MKKHYVCIHDEGGEKEVSDTYSEQWQAESAAELNLKQCKFGGDVLVYELKARLYNKEVIIVQKEDF